MFSPSSLSHTVITATFGRAGLLSLKGVGSGECASDGSVDKVLSGKGLSASAANFNK